MELNKSDPQSPLFVFQVLFVLFSHLFLYARLQQSEMLSFHNIKKTDPLLNGVYLWASLSLLVYSKHITGLHLLKKKNTMAATSYISRFILNITLQYESTVYAILGHQAN